MIYHHKIIFKEIFKKEIFYYLHFFFFIYIHYFAINYYIPYAKDMVKEIDVKRSTEIFIKIKLKKLALLLRFLNRKPS